jgi:outer membrane protein OmpA-like peptidoglycan-associated protein
MKRIIIVLLFIFPDVFCSAQVTEKLIVYFKFNDYTLDDIYKNKIDSLLQNNIIREVQIEAHCDSVGSNTYNDTLSLKRALEVKHYLQSKKNNPEQFNIKALGKRFPLNKNENETERAFNRRAEIIFVNKEIKTVVKTDTLPKDTTSVNITDIKVGSSFKLKNLNFVGGRHKLLPKSEGALHQLLNTLKSNPSLEIEIQGYICCIPGTDDGLDFDTGTDDLSVNRAKAIYDYLIENGIDPSRLSYKGFGGSNKLVEEITEKDRETNRRVEFKVIKK